MLLVLCIALHKLWKYTTQPFVFENFGTSEEARTYFDAHYPPGSEVWSMIEEVQKAGGWCSLIGKKTWAEDAPREPFEYKATCGCNYYNDLISLRPLGTHSIFVFVDEDSRIIERSYHLRHDKFIP